MRTTARRGLTTLATALALVVTALPGVAAADSPSAAWTVTSAPPALDPADALRPAPSAALAPIAPSRATLAAPEDDLRRECQNRPEAETRYGWAKDRFLRCWRGNRKVELKKNDSPIPGGGTKLAEVDFDYTLLGVARNGSRQVDFTFTFDKFEPSGGQERNISDLRVEITGCTTQIVCAPNPSAATRTITQWELMDDRSFGATWTTPDNTGEGLLKTISAPVGLNMSIVTTGRPDVRPWSETGMASGATVRFDSAGAKAGKHHGTVFSDVIPTFNLRALAARDGRSGEVMYTVRHIEDALLRPIRTFPSFPFKSPPGRYRADAGLDQRPLHRLFDDAITDKNRAAAGKVCNDVWGDRARDPNLDCDEYPFASTQEGAWTATNQATQPWHGSARLIPSDDNQTAGRAYLSTAFYQANRLLDWDAFYVQP
ncbi:NucA/NucB deoxyribonuclease domain-containing protein [Micromonospora coxensis]|uniref:Deoxyribonuclease NucA/NucB n=1 Tax=Micromonospora coxensis TaxID=356852 RepID=A0A1C5GZ72_9ACTN|nr:NucA/NucB deoxyribonuclease domain-containing protein [Micromonospora coxensis]SCG39119.1 Deoxyribonuclease NucA/NucB [Micromonospora coxensis]